MVREKNVFDLPIEQYQTNKRRGIALGILVQMQGNPPGQSWS